MKIRSDFVTNSSSYSFAEVIIDNPVLLEILMKYKDLGTFDNVDGRTIDFGRDSLPVYSRKATIRTPAFVYCHDETAFSTCPTSLSEVLDLMIEVVIREINYPKKLDEELFNSLKAELDQQRNEIESAYVYVYWKAQENMLSQHERTWIYKFELPYYEHYEREQDGTDGDFQC